MYGHGPVGRGGHFTRKMGVCLWILTFKEFLPCAGTICFNKVPNLKQLGKETIKSYTSPVKVLHESINSETRNPFLGKKY